MDVFIIILHLKESSNVSTGLIVVTISVISFVYFFNIFLNPEAFASEFQEDLKEMFPQYNLYCYIFSMPKSSSTQYCVARLKKS